MFDSEDSIDTYSESDDVMLLPNSPECRGCVFIKSSSLAQGTARNIIVVENEDDPLRRDNFCPIDRLRLPQQEFHNKTTTDTIDTPGYAERSLPGLTKSNVRAHGRLMDQEKRRTDRNNRIAPQEAIGYESIEALLLPSNALQGPSSRTPLMSQGNGQHAAWNSPRETLDGCCPSSNIVGRVPNNNARGDSTVIFHTGDEAGLAASKEQLIPKNPTDDSTHNDTSLTHSLTTGTNGSEERRRSWKRGFRLSRQKLGFLSKLLTTRPIRKKDQWLYSQREGHSLHHNGGMEMIFFEADPANFLNPVQ